MRVFPLVLYYKTVNFMTATTINATINSLNFGAAATRIDIWHEGGGIGHWELELDNITGASQILSANLVASNLGINGVNLMAGYVDDVLPEVTDESAVFSKYVKVTGRNYGRDLANKFLIKKFAATKFDDLIDDALAITESEIGYISPHTAPVVDADFNKTYLQNGFVDAAKLVDYDFTVKNDISFQLWALASAPSSGVLLKAVAGAIDNNILKIDPETKAGVGICNYIRVDAGTLNDHWTEGNAVDFTGVNCTVANDSTVFLAGASSIRATISTNAWTNLYLQFPKYNYQSLDLSDIPVADLTLRLCRSVNAVLQIYLKDDAGNEITKNFDMPTANKWYSFTFPIGTDASFSGSNPWYYLSGSNFTWNITRIGILIENPGAGGVGGHFWVDGLKFGPQFAVDVFAIAQDAGSQATYGQRMIPLTRTDVKSQLQLQDIADSELIVRKDPVYKLTFTCTLQTGLLYAGYLVDVLAPDAYIGSGVTPVVYRILSIHHTAEPGVDLCMGNDAITVLELVRHDGGVGADPTRFKLATSPQVAINTRYDSRLRVLEGSLTGSGSIVGGGGGGGAPDWMNVPYIKVLGNAFFEDLTQLECTCPSFTWAQLEPYIWGFSGGSWTPDALELALGDAKLRFKDFTDSYYFDVGVIRTNMDVSPILWFSHAVMCKKDFFCGGFVSSAQGALFLGSGLEAVGDMPQIVLSHSEVGYGYKNILEINTAGGVLANVKVSKIYVDYIKKVNDDSWLFAELDAYSYLTNTVGVRLFYGGTERSDIYENRIGTSPNYSYVVEISGTGVIIDGALNVDSIASTKAIGIAIATGTSPLSITSTTVCSNLNVDLLDGSHASAFLGATAQAVDSDKLDGHHSSEFAILDSGYITLTGIHFGTGWGDIYHQTVGGIKLLEISGTGVIIDGYLNVASISSGNIGIATASGFAELYISRTSGQITSLLVGTAGAELGFSGYLTFGTITGAQGAGYTELMKLVSAGNLEVVGNIGADGQFLFVDYNHNGNGILQWGNANYQSMRLAMTTAGYDATHLSVMSLQWNNNGTWDLGILNLGQLNLDHINSATGASIYVFDKMIWQYPVGTTVASIDRTGILGMEGYIQFTKTTGDTSPVCNTITAGTKINFWYGNNQYQIGLNAVGAVWNTSLAGFYWLRDNASTLLQTMYLDAAGTLTLAGNLWICGRKLYDDGIYLRSASSFVCDTYCTVGQLSGSGTRAVYSDLNGTLTNTASSKRYKENIRNLDDCSWIYNLNPVMFNWIDKKQGEGDYLGLIAEDVMALSPQLAFSNLKGEPEGVHYEMLAVPMLVEMKKLRAEVEDLRSQINKIRGIKND
jgi:hypothetical protein